MKKTMLASLTVMMLAGAMASTSVAAQSAGGEGVWQDNGAAGVSPGGRSGDARHGESRDNRADRGGDRGDRDGGRGDWRADNGRDDNRDNRDNRGDRDGGRGDWRADNGNRWRGDRDHDRDRDRDRDRDWRGDNGNHNGWRGDNNGNGYGWRDDRRDDRRNDRGWRDDRRDWGNDRFDWRDGRRDNRYYTRYHDSRWNGHYWYPQYRYRAATRYVYPRDYRPYRWQIGYRLPYSYYEPQYYVDYRTYRLPPPPYGYHWVRVDRDVVLISLATGLIRDVLYGLYY